MKKQPVQEGFSSTEELIRRFKANPAIFIGTVVVLVIVIVAFVFVPAIVPSAGGGWQEELNFGTYDKIPINYVPGNYFAETREELARSQQSSVNDSNYQVMDFRIWQEAFERTVEHIGILQEMKAAGYSAPEEVVDEEVAALPIFQENGRFSAARYRQLDNASQMNLWRQVQENIVEERYRSDIADLLRSSREEEFIIAMGTLRRTFDGAAFSVSSYPDTELIAYAEQNSGNFRSTHLSRITINSSEREARQVLGSVKDGVLTFEEAARTQSQDSYAERGGDMGVKMVYELSTEISDAQQREGLIALARGEISDLLQIGSGWVFFRAEENSYPADTSDPGTLEKIRSYVMGFERGRVDTWFIGQAEDLVNDTALNGFEDAVYSKGLTKFTFGPVALNYGDLGFFPTLSSFSIPELEDNYASTNLNFWQTAFSTPLNVPSKPLVLGNAVIVLYPKEEVPADEGEAENIKAYFSYYLSISSMQELRSFFTGNEKLENRFWTTYQRYFMPQNY
ncbi:MAG: SurA N-terminal domain-containing protein [Treponema sp.]|nr:SurA N-terminal domain-containing protein [Treponema sp.]